VNDKYKKMYNKQEDTVRQKASDINMIKEREKELENQTEYMKKIMETQNMQQQAMKQQIMENQFMQQQVLEKQKQLEDLQKQLQMQRSDTRSTYTKSSQHNIQSAPIQQSRTIIPSQSGPIQQSATQPVMKMPTIPSSLRKKNAVFVPQTNNKIINATEKSDKSEVSIHPELDNIITAKFNDVQSNDLTSRGSTTRRKKRRATIKIDT
jgi:hypothetical protein